MKGYPQYLLSWIAYHVMVCWQPSACFTEVDPQWISANVMPVKIACAKSSKITNAPNLPNVSQFSPFVLQSPNFGSQATYKRKEKCKAIISMPKEAEVYLYFRKFDVAEENSACGGDYLLVKINSNLFSSALKFCGSQWEGKLVKLDTNPLMGSKLRFDFATNGNKKLGKGFQVYIFGKYDTSKGTPTSTSPTTTATTAIIEPNPYSSGLFLILPIGGNPKVINVANPSDICDWKGVLNQDYQNPYFSSWATWALLEDKYPMICGGNHLPICYFPTTNREPLDMLTSRVNADSFLLNSTHMLITGGYMSVTSQDLATTQSTTEFMTVNGSAGYGPDLPMALSGHCSIKINSSLAIVVGGMTINGALSNEVFYLDLKTFQWRSGPELPMGRFAHACQTFKDDQGKTYLVVAGGVEPNMDYVYYENLPRGSMVNSPNVEILSLDHHTWVKGPDLPTFIHAHFQMVQSQCGKEVTLLGAFFDSQNIWYNLRCCNGLQNCYWLRIKERYSGHDLRRIDYHTFPIPHEQAKCGITVVI